MNRFILGLLLAAVCSVKAQTPSPNAAAQTTIARFDQPFLFAYGTWEKKARTENGEVMLNAGGITPKGGGGVNVPLDLAGHDEDCPALRVKVGSRNTLAMLKLLLADTTGHSATYWFAVPKSTADPVILKPVDGASFSHPNETDKKGPLDLAKVMQWQMIGDWGGDGPVDLRVEAILAIKPNDEIRQVREELVKKAKTARLQAEKDRLADRERYSKRTVDSPEIEAVYAAAPDVLALSIRTGKLTPCKLTDYQPLPSDVRDDNGGKDRPHLKRNGQDLGMLIGPTGKETGLVTFEGFSGEPLLLAEADDVANYKITSADDPAFTQATAPLKVARKSKTEDWQQPIQSGLVIRHIVYLQLPRAMIPGKTYTATVGHLNTQKPEATLRFDPATVRSESVHVNQVGFRPSDPLKQAFVSLWMGSGGGYEFPSNLTFHLVNVDTGKRVFDGHAGETWPASKPEKMQSTRNFNGASVTPLDFSTFKAPGKYCVEVEGIGCSYPFEIGDTTWERAFWVQMKGFYNERSGIDLGPPYTDFVRPVCLKPGVNDCLPVTQSTYNMVDDQPGGLAKNDTGKSVPEAWGGYHDAGDWNPRRITHMTTTTYWQLELLQLFPEYFSALKLNIPNDAPGPDLLKECLFELDLFRRLQMPDGSCRFGIETDGDPALGEVSWKQHLPGYVYGADAYSSYIFTAVAARAAQVLEAYDQSLAKTYRDGAIKAMTWAEADRVRRKASGTWDKLSRLNINDERSRAAVCLYALTQDPQWHQVFLEDTLLKTDVVPVFRGNTVARDAAFTYARLPEGLGDAQIKQRARRALLADADGSLGYQQNNAFGIASDDFGKPHFLGFYSTPHGAISLVRAHYLTGDGKYLSGAVKACLFPGGANPNNMVYTSGVGANPIKHALNMDALATGQNPPIGLTPYGNIDLSQWNGDWITWPIKWFIGKGIQPDIYTWPTAEAFFDVRSLIAQCEFCIDQTMGPNAYVWGYLAARK